MLSGAVMGLGTIGSGGSATVNVQPAVMGNIYGVRGTDDGVVRGSYLTPVKLMGISETLPSGFKMLSLNPVRGMVAEIGNGLDMAPDVKLEVPSTAPTTDQQWTAWLLVGNEAEVQPVGGGQYIIVSSTALPGTVYWNEDWLAGAGVIPLMTPTDPLLAGSVICFQWMILEGTELKFSDVLCVMLRDTAFDPGTVVDGENTEQGGAAASGSKSSSSSKAKKKRRTFRQKPSPELVARIRVWLARSGVRSLPRGLAGRLHKRMKR